MNQPFVNTTEFREHTMDIVLDNVPYLISIAPFDFNGETRYYISVNGGEKHVFTWDTDISALRAIDDASSYIPSSLEEEISRRLIAG